MLSEPSSLGRERQLVALRRLDAASVGEIRRAQRLADDDVVEQDRRQPFRVGEDPVEVCRRDRGERLVVRGEHVNGPSPFSVSTSPAACTADVSVVRYGLFDAAVATGSSAMPANEPSPSGGMDAQNGPSGAPFVATGVVSSDPPVVVVVLPSPPAPATGRLGAATTTPVASTIAITRMERVSDLICIPFLLHLVGSEEGTRTLSQVPSAVPPFRR